MKNAQSLIKLFTFSTLMCSHFNRSLYNLMRSFKSTTDHFP